MKRKDRVPRPQIEYPVPAQMPRRIKWIRRILILTGITSFLSFITAFGVFESMIGELSKVEADAREGVKNLPPDPENPLVIGADVLTVAKHFSLTMSGLLSLAFLYFPIRYVQLFRRIPKAHPDTYRSVRDLAIIQIVVELVKVSTFEAINLQTAVIKFPPAASLALPFSAVVLWMITRQSSKDFFYRPKLVPVVGAAD